MITIKKEKKQKEVTEPYYLLRYDYMIGDSNGYTTKEADISIDNPFLERYYTLLNSLHETEGTWGVVLDEEYLYDSFKENQITEDDYNFLLRLMFKGKKSTYVISPENEKYANEFAYGVQSDNEYSFLVFEGLDLKYVDEHGKKHKTEIK